LRRPTRRHASSRWAHEQRGRGSKRIRYYPGRGLLDTPDGPNNSGLGGGSRRYGPKDVRPLRFIRSAQDAGFTLEKIGKLLALDDADDRARARELPSKRSLALDAKIEELER
jgi:MerR family mercuric resistance operon transcriptional regulator